MKQFLAVYNMKSSDFFSPKVHSIEEFLTSNDFISVGIVKAEDVDDVYRILNIAHPIEIIKYIEKLHGDDPLGTEYPSLHSSMSVGDVVVEYTSEGKVYHMCDRRGWTILK